MTNQAGTPRDGDIHAVASETTPLIKTPSETVPVQYSTQPVNGSDPPRDDEQQRRDEQEEERTIITQGMTTTRLALIMGTTWFGCFLGAADSTIIATLSGPISSEFKSLSLLSWLATGYLIANAACQPISGRLTDIFGRGPGLVFSNILFAIGNAICALAHDEYTMIIGRVVAGIGGGGLMSISTFLGSDLIPLRNRGVIQGIGNICYGAGAMLGGVFGGIINDHSRWGWRLAFMVQVPPVLLSAVAVAFLVKVPPKQSDKSYLARIDFLGAFLTVAFLVLLLLGLNSGGNSVPWSHPLPLTTIPLSLVAFAGFIYWESRARQPIIPVKLFTNRTVLAACLCNLACNMVVMAGLFYIPLAFQVLGSTATQAGLQILPSPIGVSVGSLTCGYIMKRTGKYVVLACTSVLLIVVGIFMYTLIGPNTPVQLISVGLFLVGTGFGAMLTATLLACIAAVDHSQQAVVTSATYLARSLGGTLGVTVGSTVYQNVLKKKLWARFGGEPNAAELIRRIRDDLSELKHLPEGWHDGVIASFIEAFQAVWLTLLGIAILGLICSTFLRQHTLHSSLERR